MKNNGLIIYMIGWMIYETVDLVSHLGGMTYRVSKYIYDWYYEIPTQDEIEINSGISFIPTMGGSHKGHTSLIA